MTRPRLNFFIPFSEIHNPEGINLAVGQTFHTKESIAANEHEPEPIYTVTTIHRRLQGVTARKA